MCWNQLEKCHSDKCLRWINDHSRPFVVILSSMNQSCFTSEAFHHLCMERGFPCLDSCEAIKVNLGKWWNALVIVDGSSWYQPTADVMDQGVGSGAQEDHLNLSIPFPSGLPDVAMKHWNRVHFNRFLKDWWQNNTSVLFLIKCHLKKCVFVHIKNTLHDVLQRLLFYFSCAIQCPLRRMQDEYIAKQVQVRTIQVCCTHAQCRRGWGSINTNDYE